MGFVVLGMSSKTKSVKITSRNIDSLFPTLFCKNGIDKNSSSEGHMFETYGTELDAVLAAHKKDPKRVATLLDCDGKTYICSGYHLVNRLGYFIGKAALPEFSVKY